MVCWQLLVVYVGRCRARSVGSHGFRAPRQTRSLFLAVCHTKCARNLGTGKNRVLKEVVSPECHCTTAVKSAKYIAKASHVPQLVRTLGHTAKPASKLEASN